MQEIILASTSPRRAEIMSYFSLPFKQVAPLYSEGDSQEFFGDPIRFATHTATQKALSLKEDYPEQVIIASDTIVYVDGQILLKPTDQEEGFKSLKKLTGKTHEVYSAISLIHNGEEQHMIDKTTVHMNQLSDDQIRQYQEKLNCRDKAGGYAIQGSGGLIVNRIEGCYYNVMGFPINILHTLLLKVGIDLWDYLDA